MRRRQTKGGEDSDKEEGGGRGRRGTARRRESEGDHQDGKGGCRGSEFNFKRDLEEEDDEKRGYHGNL